VNMFIVILIRSYKDIKEAMIQGDDPIAAEIRNWFRVQLKRFIERLSNMLPAVHSGASDEAEEEDMLGAMGMADKQAAEGAADKMKKKHALEINDIKLTMQQIHLCHLEIKFLAERVQDTAKKQAALNRDDTHDGMEDLLEERVPSVPAQDKSRGFGRVESGAPGGLTIMGGKFGKFPSRPTSSTTSRSQCSTPVRFDTYRNLDIEWMPPNSRMGNDEQFTSRFLQ